MSGHGSENNILTEQGYKNTRSRRAILNILEHSDRPLTAEDIFIKAREYGSMVNLSTIYRNLELMEKNNLIEKTIINDGKARYELSGEKHRHHLVCINCNKMVTIENCPLEKLAKEVGHTTKFDITGHRLELYGVCPECKKS